LVAVENHFAGFEGVFFEVFAFGGENYPAFFAGLPEAVFRESGEFGAEAVEMFRLRVKPDAVEARFFFAVAEREKELFVEVDVREAEHLFDDGAKR